jgi:thermopsin
VLGIAAVALLGWIGIGGSGPVHDTGASVPDAAPGAISGPASSVGAAHATPSVLAPSENLATAMATHALAATRAAGLRSDVVFLPRPSATPAEAAAIHDAGAVTPLYQGTPAPAGVTYYGLSGTGSGSVVPTILRTTALEGFVDANATGIRGLDLMQATPDSYGIQLNAVVTNVTVFGKTTNPLGVPFQYWTQDVVEYAPSADELILLDNVWNFTGGGYDGAEFYSHGPDGTNDYAGLGYYYAEEIVPYPVTYPFNLTLSMTSGVTDGRNNVSFAVSLENPIVPSEDFSTTFDWVDFNSTAGGHGPIAGPAEYTANGYALNPVGLTNDFELDLCGPGGGSQVDLETADATLGLAYYTGSAFAAVPAAYSYGGETGETATGANVAWSDVASRAPGGLADYATVSTGPELLTGLWGTGAPNGSSRLTLAETPANAFNFLTYDGDPGVDAPVISEAAYVPNIATATFALMPGTYVLITELSEYDPVRSTFTLTAGTPLTLPIALVSDPATGVYTPLWAFTNAEVADLATSGAGTPADPYLIEHNQYGPIGVAFGLYNDFTFPAFSGVLLDGTTVSVEFLDPPSFSTVTNDTQYPGDYLPQTNDLPYWFLGVQNVSIVGASNISGWFGSDAYYPLAFDTFNVVFYASSHNLVAGNTFDTESDALSLFAGGTYFGPINVGGGNNTVWGNHFAFVKPPHDCPGTVLHPNTCLALVPAILSLGIQVGERFDLIYNNAVSTPTTAWLAPANLYSGRAESFDGDRWNITPVAATVANYAEYFPYEPLSGSIVGGTTQGGNFWWDYGLISNPYNGADNPYGLLPYDENTDTVLLEYYGTQYYYLSYLYPGGDYDPLTPSSSGETVTFHGHGLVAGETWGVTVIGTSQQWDLSTSGSTIPLVGLTPGRYVWGPDLPTGYNSNSGGTFHVKSHDLSIRVSFHLAKGFAILTFHESGLAKGTPWTVTLYTTSTLTLPFGGTRANLTGPVGQFVVVDGTYTYAVPGLAGYGVPGYTPSPASGTVMVHGGTRVPIRFHPTPFEVTFQESGAPSGGTWSVHLHGPFRGHGDQTRSASTTTDSLAIAAPNGTYSISITSPAHYTCTASSGSVTVAGAPVTVTVSCSPNDAAPARPAATASEVTGPSAGRAGE